MHLSLLNGCCNCYSCLISTTERVGTAKQMKKRLMYFLDDTQAQDLIEYTLILAFVALASAGLMMGAGGGVSNIWGTATSTLDGICDPGFAHIEGRSGCFPT
jgi:Flp pilus assembly pilin Flp